MSPSSDLPRRLRYRAGTAGALALIGLLGPAPAFALPPGSTTPVVPIDTSVITFAGGTAELDGSTTLERTRTGTRSRIDCTILFAKDSDQLRPGAGDKLRRLATQLQRQGPGRVQVTGYTDDLGSAAHGLDLSRRRAQQVATTLADTLPAKTFPMTVRGRGEADPAVPNTSETNRRKNRRVTVILTITTRPQATADPTTRVEPSAGPTATPTATPNLAPTVTSAGTADPEPTDQATAVPSAAAPPPADPPSAPPSDPSSNWPFTAGLGAALMLTGATIDQVRRRRRTPDEAKPPAGQSPGPSGPPQPPPNPALPDHPQRENTTAAPRTPAPSTAVLQPGTESSATHPPTTRPGLPDSRGTAVLTLPTPALSAPQTPLNPKGSSPLEADLAAWFSTNTHRPRLTLLGPVQARTHGQALARRKPYYTELLAYLTLKPHGATVDEIADTFTLTTARVRTDMKILRDWLGTNPTTGQPYLPDARTSPAALQRGLPTYQVQDALCDYHLFTQLQTRATTTPDTGPADLDTALRLVTGEPFSHTRTNGWHWIFEGNRLDLHATTAIVTMTETAAKHHQPHSNYPTHQQTHASAANAKTR
jgi:outer membrane protein OmpA-like peptidoglycan-associated protein